MSWHERNPSVYSTYLLLLSYKEKELAVILPFSKSVMIQGMANHVAVTLL